MLSKFWEQNKRFLLQVGSGFAVFLILNALLGIYVNRADSLLAKASRLEREIRELKKELSQGYWQEKTRLDDYGTHEKNLRADLELPAEKELASFDAAVPLLQFNQAISRVWGEVLDQANRMGVTIPEKLTTDDFGIERGATVAEYGRPYDYLAVLRRALGALVEAGMTEIQRPEVIEDQDIPIAGNDKVICRLRPVGFNVTGSFESFLRVLKSVQKVGNFLQVRIVQLGPKRGDERALSGTLEFSGIRLLEAAADELKAAKTKGKGPVRRKKR